MYGLLLASIILKHSVWSSGWHRFIIKTVSKPLPATLIHDRALCVTFFGLHYSPSLSLESYLARGDPSRRYTLSALPTITLSTQRPHTSPKAKNCHPSPCSRESMEVISASFSVLHTVYHDLPFKRTLKDSRLPCWRIIQG
jgi:hypothetical protein